MAAAPLILASSSPRRLSLLEQLGIVPAAVIPPDIDENPQKRELPNAYALRLARTKAVSVAGQEAARGAFILAADTVVACGRRVLPKPEDRASARRCIEFLSGRRHRVYGGVAVAAPDGSLRSRVVMTQVRFKRLSPLECECYLDSGEWQGKAGGYAIQGRAARFIPAINGSYSNVVGLPLFETMNLLEGLGWRAA